MSSDWLFTWFGRFLIYPHSTFLHRSLVWVQSGGAGEGNQGEQRGGILWRAPGWFECCWWQRVGPSHLGNLSKSWPGIWTWGKPEGGWCVVGLQKSSALSLFLFLALSFSLLRHLILSLCGTRHPVYTWLVGTAVLLCMVFCSWIRTDLRSRSRVLIWSVATTTSVSRT